MKRKLNIDNVPEEAELLDSKIQTSNPFQSLALDGRLLQAIANEGFAQPTPIQAKAIPSALEGRDILGNPKAIQTLEDI